MLISLVVCVCTLNSRCTATVLAWPTVLNKSVYMFLCTLDSASTHITLSIAVKHVFRVEGGTEVDGKG
jgi:hypothetical protein